jgi:hypothetical protein
MIWPRRGHRGGRISRRRKGHSKAFRDQFGIARTSTPRPNDAELGSPLTPEDEELRAWLVDAGEAARQFLESRAGDNLTDPTDLEMRGHCEAVVAFDDGLRPEMTMAELADHFDAIQRLAEARADATLKRFRERADEARGTPK